MGLQPLPGVGEERFGLGQAFTHGNGCKPIVLTY